MPDYRKVYLDRVKQGKATGNPQGGGKITFDDPNIIDNSGDGPPKIPPKPNPQSPTDDKFAKFRTEQA